MKAINNIIYTQLKYFFTIFISLSSLSCDDDTNIICNSESETGTVSQISNDEARVYTPIVINVTPSQVWSVLTV